MFCYLFIFSFVPGYILYRGNRFSGSAQGMLLPRALAYRATPPDSQINAHKFLVKPHMLSKLQGVGRFILNNISNSL